MAEATDPGRAEVVGWMARQPQPSAIEAVRHFFPGISPDAQQEKAAIYRVWWSRAKAAGQVSAPPPPAPQGPQGRHHHAPPPVLDLPDPPANLADLSDEAYRVWQLDYLAACLRASKRSVREATTVLEQMARARSDLEALRKQQGATVKLEPTPQAVALDMAGEDKVIRLLVEAAEAMKQAEQQTKEGT